MISSSDPVLFAPTLPRLDKPLMVMLPGLDGTGELFVSQLSKLSRQFDVRCLKIPVTNRQNWEALAQSVVRLIREVQEQRDVYLCGESFGGCLALQIALTAPELLSCLVVINPASALRRYAWTRWATQYVSLVPGWLYQTSGAIALPLLANFDRISLQRRELFIKTVRSIPQACVTWRISLLHKFVVQPQQFERITVPTALLASGSDRLFPSMREAKILQTFMPHARIYGLPESGHVCLLEDAVDLAQCLEDLQFSPSVSAMAPSR